MIASYIAALTFLFWQKSNVGTLGLLSQLVLLIPLCKLCEPQFCLNRPLSFLF